MILGYHYRDFVEYGIKLPISIIMPKRHSNILIAGKSGSGKSLSTLWYLWEMLVTGESVVYIADYKAGEEYEMFEESRSYASGVNAIQMIKDFYEFFTLIRQNKIRKHKHYTLVIEEYFGLLTYAESQSKKLKTEIMAMVGEMLSVSRGLNMGLIVNIQRADASAFTSGARDQFQVVISFGRCSTEHFKMLGFSGELEENPTTHYKSGQALALVDGQDSVYEIIVPLIKNSNTMCKQILKYLNMQSDIPSLIRSIGEDRDSNL